VERCYRSASKNQGTKREARGISLVHFHRTPAPDAFELSFPTAWNVIDRGQRWLKHAGVQRRQRV
jgi:hypothetical protein